MARMKVGPGSAKSRISPYKPTKAAYSKQAISSAKASGMVNRNSSSVYNTGSNLSKNKVLTKPASLTSKIAANKVVTKKR